MNTLRSWAAALALATMAGAAPAALVLQANNVEVLDTDTNLLWLYSWHQHPNPLKTWAEGNAWAAGLTTGGAAAGQWRLPVISEFDDLWADPAVGDSNNGLDANFIDVVGTSLYWSGTSTSSTLALYFSPQNGISNNFNKDSTLYVVAVRSAAAGPGPRAVAEPHSAALALLGLGAVALHRRRPGAARVGANKFTPTAGA